MSQQSELSHPVRMIEIDSATASQRIDNFLIARLKGVPKSRIYRMIRTGEVRVNKGRAKAQYRLQSGDIVRIPPVRVSVSPVPPVSSEMLKDRLDHRIVYEDQDLLIINKPFGIAVHGGTGLSFGLIEGLRKLRNQDRFLELVHRLDRDTSGCLLIARKRSVLKSLHEAFRGDRVHKVYAALLSGVPSWKKCQVNQPLKKRVKPSGEWKVEIDRDGRESLTNFRRQRRFQESTLVEARPVTGRTHQIRVHAASMGLPIAGDERYGDADLNRRLRKSGLKRLFLHASRLEFEHPRTGAPMKIDAPLDQELVTFLDRLPGASRQ